MIKNTGSKSVIFLAPQHFLSGLLMLLVLAAGCVPKHGQAPPKRVEPPAPVQDRFHSPEELGWELLEVEGSTHVRWKESISPPTATLLPLMSGLGPFATTPRVAAVLNSKLVVPVTFDTGSPVNVFERAVAREAGFKFADSSRMATVFRGVAGSRQMDYASVDSVRMSGLEIKGMLAAVHGSRGRGKKFETDYLIGMTTIQKFSYVTFDYPGRSLEVSVAGLFPEVEGSGVVKVPFRVIGEQIVIEVHVNNEYAIEAFVDTGSDASLLIGRRMASELELDNEILAGKATLLGGLGGTVKAVSFEVSRLDLGGRAFPNAEVVVVENDFPAGLGSGFLRQFKATLDFSRSILWLEGVK